MIALVANTVTKLVAGSKERRFFRMMSDSTTVTRLSLDQGLLEAPGTGGFGLTAYESLIIDLSPGKEIFAVSTGTPNISFAKISHAIPGEAIQA